MKDKPPCDRHTQCKQILRELSRQGGCSPALAASDLEHRPGPVLCVTNHEEQMEGEGTLGRAQGPAGDLHKAGDGSAHTGWT